MSLINDASLVLTPNAVKGGKLYSVIPSNGNGDMTVVRATTATRVNELGLIEPTPYNLLTFSEEFSNASWVKSNSSITPNSIIAPNGTLTADTLTSTATNGFMYQNFSAIPNVQYTFSFWVKSVSDSVSFQVNFYNSGLAVTFSTVTVTTTNNWQRITLTGTSPSTQVANIVIGGLNTFSTPESVYIWGAQLVQGSVQKDYFYTTNRLNVPRLNYDSVGGCPSILVEPQRTNLLTYSDDFITNWVTINATTTANTGISPDGTLSSDQIVSTGGGVYRGIVIQPNTTYTYSVYIKYISGNGTLNVGFEKFGANFVGGTSFFNIQNGTITTNGNLVTSSSITPISNGWYRLTVTLTTTNETTATMISYSQANNTFLIWGAQLEQGSYATSYIPTVATSVTRNTDAITRNNIYTNGLITSAGGTWFIEIDNNLALVRDTFSNGIYISDNLTAGLGNAFYFRNSQVLSSRMSVLKIIGGIGSTIATTSTDKVKLAIDWNGTTADVFVNGVKVVTGTSFTTTNMEFLGINGIDVPKYIKSMMLFPKPLTDVECIALTTL